MMAGLLPLMVMVGGVVAELAAVVVASVEEAETAEFCVTDFGVSVAGDWLCWAAEGDWSAAWTIARNLSGGNAG